jgi:hypothetical protein
MSLLVARRREHVARRAGNSHGDRVADLPRLTTTVPREYVHRASLAEVFLSSCERVSETRFTLTGQWPRAHTFFSSSDGRQHDPLQAVETLRQAGIYLVHAKFGVPLSHQIIMWDMRWDVDPNQLAIGPAPTDLRINAHYIDQAQSDGIPSRGRFVIKSDIWRDDRLVATSTTHFSCVSAAAYRRLRGEAPRTPYIPPSAGQSTRMHPARVGRSHRNDVVLAPTDKAGRWLLAPDLCHPIMFDHQADHVPGMVLLEAARQASCAMLPDGATLLPTQMVSEFHRYVEFSSPCWIEAAPLPAQEAGSPGFLVTGRQNGQQVFTARVSGLALPSQ